MTIYLLNYQRQKNNVIHHSVYFFNDNIMIKKFLLIKAHKYETQTCVVIRPNEENINIKYQLKYITLRI